MTQNETIKAIKALGCVVSVTDGEWRVRPGDHMISAIYGITDRAALLHKGEMLAAYCGDREEALATAHATAEWAAKFGV